MNAYFKKHWAVVVKKTGQKCKHTKKVMVHEFEFTMIM